jgi:hypothetical protein
MFDEHDFQLAGFFDFEDVASLVGAALGAGAMRHLLLVAIGALGKRMAFEGIVRAPGRGALLGVSSFWIGHVSKFLSRDLFGQPQKLKKHSALGIQPLELSAEY